MDSIGSFAENLILQDINEVKTGKALPPALRNTSIAPASKDIREVEIPDSFMKEVLGEEYTSPIKSSPDKEENDPTPPSPSKTMGMLVEEFAQVVQKAQTILDEMTAVGSLGVAGIGATTSDPFKEKKKKKKTKKSNTALDLLRKKIKNRGNINKTSKKKD